MGGPFAEPLRVNSKEFEMIIFDENRPSDSPFVERVWRCHSEGAAPFLRYATHLLQQGVSILDTVEQAGYFDQPHLTRSLKYLIGQTPAQILQKSRPEQMPFLYKTTPFE
jgi:AraC-like DNA-binding protein